MRCFKLARFAQFMSDEGIDEKTLEKAAKYLEDGGKADSLGANVFKLRLPREGEGKSGGFRALVFYRAGERIFFAHGFPKSKQANISKSEKIALKKQAAVYMQLAEAQLNELAVRCKIYEF